MLNFARQFFNSRLLFHTLYLAETKSVNPNFFCTFETNNSLPHCGKRNLRTGKFSRERP